MEEKKVIMSVQLTVSQKKRLSDFAKDRGIGASTLLRQIVKKWLDESMSWEEYSSGEQDAIQHFAYENAMQKKPQPTFQKLVKTLAQRINLSEKQTLKDMPWLRPNWWTRVCNEAKKYQSFIQSLGGK